MKLWYIKATSLYFNYYFIAREWNSVETRNHSEPPNKKQCRQRLVESELPEREIPSEPRESLSLACRPRHSNKISISIGSPKSAVHHEAEDSLEGRRIVSRLLERLQEQSHLLSKRSNDANKHCKELNHCMNRILRVHKEIGNEEENDMISVELQRWIEKLWMWLLLFSSSGKEAVSLTNLFTIRGVI